MTFNKSDKYFLYSVVSLLLIQIYFISAVFFISFGFKVNFIFTFFCSIVYLFLFSYTNKKHEELEK